MYSITDELRAGLPRPAVSFLMRNDPQPGTPMTLIHPQIALELWRRAIVESVRREAPDLSARQLAVMLTVYKTDPPHTVRGLAAALNVAKPAITRAVDRLSRLGFVRRRRDEADKRNVLIQRTMRGSVFLSEFGDIVAAASHDLVLERGDG
jgi:DNA-binding MarR family transcriptional regulator